MGSNALRQTFLGCLSVLFLLMAGRVNPVRADEEPISVFVSILPQEYLVERIGGERVSVQALVQPGHSPHTYDPSPRQMAALSRARVFFRIGVGFERGFLPKIEAAHPGLLIVDTRKGIPLRTMSAHHHHHHHDDEDHSHSSHAHGVDADPAEGHAHPDHPDHGHEKHAHTQKKHPAPDHAHKHDHDHDHDHAHGHGHEDKPHPHAHHAHHHDEGGKDPHIWLNPRWMKMQARTIADTLIELDPGAEARFEANYAALARDLDALDASLRAALAPVQGGTLFVFHPAWGYFADEYGLVQTAIETEGKAPTAQQLARLIEQAKAADVRVIFVQPQMSTQSAQAVAEAIGGAVVPINPLARDYIANLEAVASSIRAALAPDAESGHAD